MTRAVLLLSGLLLILAALLVGAQGASAQSPRYPSGQFTLARATASGLVYVVPECRTDDLLTGECQFSSLPTDPAPEPPPVTDPAPEPPPVTDPRDELIEELRAEVGLLESALRTAESNLIAMETARQHALEVINEAQRMLMASEAARNAAQAEAQALAAAWDEMRAERDAALLAAAAGRAEEARLNALVGAYRAEIRDLEGRIHTAFTISGAAAPETLEGAVRRLRQINIYLTPTP